MTTLEEIASHLRGKVTSFTKLLYSYHEFGMKIPRIWHEDPPSIVHALPLTVLHFLNFSLINLIYPRQAGVQGSVHHPVPTVRVMYKNQLQEYTQKLAKQLPSYQTDNEGSPHMPKFRTAILVDVVRYNMDLVQVKRRLEQSDQFVNANFSGRHA
ncbi:hypothetical protein P3S67_030284 [Capsicum chacoense]